MLAKGERFIPGEGPSMTALEHLHRYHFVLALVKGMSVVDLGCGIGYGSALLAGKARSVIGIDISEESIKHARERYPANNLEFRVASAFATDLPAGSADVVVCFELIEHIMEQEALLDEIRRILKPAGILVMSTPNIGEYHVRRTDHNPFHCKELTRGELRGFLDSRFAHVHLFGQFEASGTTLVPEDHAEASAQTLVFEGFQPLQGSLQTEPIYYLAMASAQPFELPPPSSLADISSLTIREYTRQLQDARKLLADHEKVTEDLRKVNAEIDKVMHNQKKVLNDQSRVLKNQEKVLGDQKIVIEHLRAVVAEKDRELARWRAMKRVAGASGGGDWLSEMRSIIRMHLDRSEAGMAGGEPDRGNLLRLVSLLRALLSFTERRAKDELGISAEPLRQLHAELVSLRYHLHTLLPEENRNSPAFRTLHVPWPVETQKGQPVPGEAAGGIVANPGAPAPFLSVITIWREPESSISSYLAGISSVEFPGVEWIIVDCRPSPGEDGALSEIPYPSPIIYVPLPQTDEAGALPLAARISRGEAIALSRGLHVPSAILGEYLHQCRDHPAEIWSGDAVAESASDDGRPYYLMSRGVLSKLIEAGGPHMQMLFEEIGERLQMVDSVTFRSMGRDRV